MGAVYRRKRRACALCKPQKRGWEPARKRRERFHRMQADEEIRDAIAYVRTFDRSDPPPGST